MITIAPSILSANFARLEQDIRQAERGGADWLHIDIMDGHFVPNISFGPAVVKTVRSISRLPLDTHLMVEEPERYVREFSEAGASRLTVHVETCPHLHRTIQQIREAGMSPGVTLNPSTPVSHLREIVSSVDLVLIMTVNPGFGGQRFIPSTLAKVREAADLIASAAPGIYLEVDGGIDERNARRVVEAGANVLVAGQSIFSKKDIPRAVRGLRSAAERKGRRGRA